MPGKTPLVGWIKGYMVPELMGIEVNIGHISILNGKTFRNQFLAMVGYKVKKEPGGGVTRNTETTAQ